MSVTVLMSGGLDSSVLAAYLLLSHRTVRGLGIDYGQRHAREIDSARAVAEALGIDFTLLDARGIGEAFGRSCLTTSEPVPHGHYEAENMMLTVVPNRNMVLLSLAAAHAISKGDDTIAYAAHAGDHAIYPDCRPEFIARVAMALNVCDYRPLELATPFRNHTKADIVRCGMSLDKLAMMSLTWSCYEGGAQHCGKCGTCVERREAFALAGVEDPTKYDP